MNDKNLRSKLNKHLTQYIESRSVLTAKQRLRGNAWPQERLWVDLGRKKIKKVRVPKSFAKHYLGGRGFNSRMLFDLVKPEVDALSPENALTFGIGPLNGTLAPGSCKYTVTAKSPLTDILGSSSSGGNFAPELRYAGYSQIVFIGRSSKPVFLWIDDHNVEIRDATQLWGKNTWETQEIVAEELDDPTVTVVCIGQAGENLVRYANVMTGLKNAAGRTGMGAVMGSKNLKAIAVRGTKDVNVARPTEFEKTCKDAFEAIEKGDNPNWSLFGSPYLMEALSPMGALGVRNFKHNVFPDCERVSGWRLKREFAVKMRAGFACPVHCRNFYVVTKGKFAGTYGDGPDFALTQCASQLDMPEMEPILYLNKLLNQYGMDVVSFYATIMWAMDCYENSIISKKDTGDLSIEWGNYDAVINLVDLTVKKEGFGKILAEGEKRAPKLLGRGSEKYMYHVKGMTPVAEDPRVTKSFGLGYYTSTRGGDHLRSLYMTVPEDFVKQVFPKFPEVGDIMSPKGKGLGTKWFEDFVAAINSCGVCTRCWISPRPRPFAKMPELLARLVSAATGFELDGKEIMQIGERVYNIEKAFNSREGLTRKDDNFTNPEKFTKEPVKDGPAKGMTLELDEMLDEYYDARKWDKKTGLQTRKKLGELGLKDIADELEKYRKIV